MRFLVKSPTQTLPLTISLMFLGLVAAGEGALEINHACASGPGCFPGDTPNYPVEITQPGSYLVTSNLTVPDENTDGILTAIESGLRLLVQVSSQRKLRSLKGKINWEGDLGEMRKD